MKLVEHTEYQGMFYVEYDDGIRTVDFYNKTRAKDYMRRIEEYSLRYPNRTAEEATRSLTGELNSELGTKVAL